MPPWFKGFSTAIARVAMRLTTAERALLLILLPRIGWDDNTLRVGNRLMRQADMARLAGLSPRQVANVVAGLVEKGVLIKRGDGPATQYILNPVLARAGKEDKEEQPRENDENELAALVWRQ